MKCLGLRGDGLEAIGDLLSAEGGHSRGGHGNSGEDVGETHFGDGNGMTRLPRMGEDMEDMEDVEDVVEDAEEAWKLWMVVRTKCSSLFGVFPRFIYSFCIPYNILLVWVTE